MLPARPDWGGSRTHGVSDAPQSADLAIQVPHTPPAVPASAFAGMTWTRLMSPVRTAATASIGACTLVGHGERMEPIGERYESRLGIELDWDR